MSNKITIYFTLFYKMMFGANVKRLLQEKNISQSALAELMGVTRQNITAILKQNNPHQKTVNNVAKALNIPAHELFDPLGMQISDAEFEQVKNSEVKNMNPSKRFLTFINEMKYSTADVESDTGIKLDKTYILIPHLTKSFSEAEIKIIAKTYRELNLQWLLTGEGKMLNPQIDFPLVGSTNNTEFREVGDRYLIVSHLVEPHQHQDYILNFDDSNYIAALPVHAIISDKLHLGTYMSFLVANEFNETKDGHKISHEEGLYKGDIVTGRKIDHTSPNTAVNIHKFKDLVVVTRKWISTDRHSANDYKNSLRNRQLLFNLGGETDFDPGDPENILEVFHIIAVTRKRD